MCQGAHAPRLNRFESVSILGFNSPEWPIATNGAIAAAFAGIYTTNEPRKYIVEHCSARVVVVEGCSCRIRSWRSAPSFPS